jgi:hypothetical protein
MRASQPSKWAKKEGMKYTFQTNRMPRRSESGEEVVARRGGG